MIKSVTVTNHVGESLTLELTRPEESGLLIQSIDGLGPAKANVSITSLASADGGLYNSARHDNRNIVIKMMFLGSPTIEDSRLLTYKYFPIKKKITLVIETENRIATIDGYVESNEPNIFSKEETCQISILCPDPYLYSSKIKYVDFGVVEPNFEFPFENDGWDPQWEIGKYGVGQVKNIYYEGDADVGFTMSITAVDDNVRYITIVNTTNNERMIIDTDSIANVTGKAFGKGDSVLICTIKGKKSMYLRRQGVLTNIVKTISKDFSWLTLTAGDNVLMYDAVSGVTNIQFSMEYRIAYEGL